MNPSHGTHLSHPRVTSETSNLPYVENKITMSTFLFNLFNNIITPFCMLLSIYY